MRPILLVLLVAYHAFAPYCGAWSLPENIEPNVAYKWLALLCRAFRLEAFVFVSGYVFAMQVIQNNKFSSFKDLAVSKIKRLILPCWFFGLLYWLIFRTTSPLKIFVGIGHLWYLPCLFWCFLSGFIIFKKQRNLKILLPILFVLSAISFLPIPFQLNKAMYYLLFFILGGVFWKYSLHVSQKASINNITISTVVFILLLILVNLFKEYTLNVTENAHIIIKAVVASLNLIGKTCLAISGILTLYLLSAYSVKRMQLTSFVVKIGVYGYGVYIFHQFILKYLYYNTGITECIDSILLPWIGFLVSLVLSLLISYLLRLTRIGRFLIG